jgi:hypothetical protein
MIAAALAGATACYEVGDDLEPEATAGTCLDGEDNDLDGEVDCGDDGCSLFRFCVPDGSAADAGSADCVPCETLLPVGCTIEGRTCDSCGEVVCPGDDFVQCTPDIPCSDGQYCATGTATCQVLAVGRCEPRPDPTTCGAAGPSVCGCDQVLYPNACAAHAAGVEVWYEGESCDCRAPGQECLDDLMCCETAGEWRCTDFAMGTRCPEAGQ